MDIRIRNKLIVEPVVNILKLVQTELTNGKLKDIDASKAGNLLITCPCHKDGYERNPSCNVSTSTETDLEPGFAHCFTCGYNAPITKLIGDCFDEDQQFGEEWLLERFGTVYVDTHEYLPEITIDTQVVKPKKNYMDEDELYKYDFYHPYMWERKLTKEVVDRFRVGYDQSRNAITFPVYDENHKLVMITARNVNTKRFYIPEGIDKPIYLLYDILERGVKTVFVAESQINTLTLRSWGYDSIGLIGTGSYKQYDILNKTNIVSYILCFDPDEGGRKGAERFKKNIRKDVFITELHMPVGKDINDLSKEEFDNIFHHS